MLEYPKAVASLRRDPVQSLTFYDFPASIGDICTQRTSSSPPLATGWLRQGVTKGAESRNKALMLAQEAARDGKSAGGRLNGLSSYRWCAPASASGAACRRIPTNAVAEKIRKTHLVHAVIHNTENNSPAAKSSFHHYTIVGRREHSGCRHTFVGRRFFTQVEMHRWSDDE
jgi:hypothetical protein